ncbi:hypothetical protein EMIT0P291_270071 [Pseudomonas sp. IT-P291]
MNAFARIKSSTPAQLRDWRQLDSIFEKGFMTDKKKPAGETGQVLLSNGWVEITETAVKSL